MTSDKRITIRHQRSRTGVFALPDIPEIRSFSRAPVVLIDVPFDMLDGSITPVADNNRQPHDTKMTITLYRPIGTAEAALLEQAGWQSFPEMPEGFGFYAYSQPTGDPREWPKQVQDIEWLEALEYGQGEVVRSWEAWGNSRDEYLVVWFEVDEQFEPVLHAPLNVDAVNEALTSDIEICARYGPSGIWVDPRIASPQ